MWRRLVGATRPTSGRRRTGRVPKNGKNCRWLAAAERATLSTMLRISPIGFAAVAVVAVLALLLGLFNWARGSLALKWAEHGSEENARLRYEVDELKTLAKDQDATIQAMHDEVESLRSEVVLAREALKAATDTGQWHWRLGYHCCRRLHRIGYLRTRRDCPAFMP